MSVKVELPDGNIKELEVLTEKVAIELAKENGLKRFILEKNGKTLYRPGGLPISDGEVTMKNYEIFYIRHIK